jgi:hypothetical protein
MADERAFNVYFGNRTVLPGEIPIVDDEALILRGGTVYRMAAAGVFAYASMTGNSDVTDIVTQDVWVPIAGTLVEGDASANFSFATNQFTFNGVNQAAPQRLSAKMSISKAGGGDEIYEVGIFVNGTQVDTGMTVGAGTTLVGFVATDNTHTLQTGDIIDMRVRNTSGTSDCTVTHAQLVLGTLG